MGQCAGKDEEDEDEELKDDGRGEADEGVLVFKLLVVGDAGVGKATMIARYTSSTSQNSFMGVGFGLLERTWDASTVVRIQFWDVAHTNTSLASGGY